jgi:hypothetical protein
VQDSLPQTLCTTSVIIYNKYENSQTAYDVLMLCDRFQYKSQKVRDRIQNNQKLASNNLAEEKRKSINVLIKDGEELVINKNTVSYGYQTIEIDALTRVKYGMSTVMTNGVLSSQSFNIGFGDNSNRISVEWGMRGIIGWGFSLFKGKNERMPVSLMPDIDQERYFKKIIGTAWDLVIPRIINNLTTKLAGGGSFYVDDCLLTQNGIQIKRGFIVKKDILVPWDQMNPIMHNGALTIFYKGSKDHFACLPIASTDNAIILIPIIDIMKKQS